MTKKDLNIKPLFIDEIVSSVIIKICLYDSSDKDDVIEFDNEFSLFLRKL